MKLVHNISDWIPEWLVEFIIDPSTGQAAPYIAEDWKDNQSLPKLWRSYGYTLDKIDIKFFEEKDLPQKIVLPDFFKNTIEIWFSKLEIGKVFPLHRDVYKYDHTTINRYWIALEDWKHGHIFQCKDIVLINYKAGDVFQFDDPKDFHGAANFGFSSKISMQVACLK